MMYLWDATLNGADVKPGEPCLLVIAATTVPHVAMVLRDSGYKGSWRISKGDPTEVTAPGVLIVNYAEELRYTCPECNVSSTVGAGETHFCWVIAEREFNG